MHGCVNIANQMKSQSKWSQIVFFEWDIDLFIVNEAHMLYDFESCMERQRISERRFFALDSKPWLSKPTNSPKQKIKF